MKPRKILYLIIFIYSAWLLTASYVFNQQVITNSISQAIRQFLTTTCAEIVLFCWISITAYVFGNWLCFRTKCKFDSRLEEFIFSIGIGLGSIAYMVFILAALKGLYTSVGYFFMFTLTVLMIPHIKRILHQTTWNVKINFSIVEIILLIVIGQHILSNFITALVPPQGACDDMAFHLAVPKIYVQNHGFIYIPYILHSNWPFLMEMLYTLGFLLTDDAILPQLFHFLTSILTLVIIYLFGRKYISARAGILASALFYTTFVVRKFAGVAYVDIGLTFFGLLAVYAFINWFYSERKNWLILSAIGCGLSMATKLTGVFPMLILTIGIFYKTIIINKKSLVTTLKLLLLFYIIGAGIVSPWLLKSYVHTGNPVWPFAYKIFGGANWSQRHSQEFINACKSHGANKRGITNFLLLPVNLIRSGNEFGFKPQYFFAPFFIYLILFMVFIRKTPHPIKYMLFYSFGYSILFFQIGQETRFLLPVLPILSLILAFWVEQFYIHKRYIFKICAFFIIIPIIYRFPLTSRSHYSRLPVILGLETRDNYLKRSLDIYPMFVWMNQNLDDNTRTLIIGEVRCFYYDRSYIWGCSENQAVINYDLYQSVSGLKNRLKELNITHVAIFAHSERTPRDRYYLKKIKNVIARGSCIVYEYNGMKLYSIKY